MAQNRTEKCDGEREENGRSQIRFRSGKEEVTLYSGHWPSAERPVAGRHIPAGELSTAARGTCASSDTDPKAE